MAKFKTHYKSAIQAYNIDQKMDDGLPQSGRVKAMYSHTVYSIWAFGSTGFGN